MSGRDEGKSKAKPIIYRAKVPNHWQREDPPCDLSIVDTTLANCTFLIEDEEQLVRITVHSFPSENLDDRIPPMAQITRWKRQLTDIDPASLYVCPKAYGGYSGLYFEACGHVQSQEVAVLAWAMQLDPRHYQAFSYSQTMPNKSSKQMRADYTIKAVGPLALIEKYKEDIHRFASSFELIESIPQLP